ncbi:MAG: glycerol-3-phosphate acyltransferase [Pseudomonadota bacterium]
MIPQTRRIARLAWAVAVTAAEVRRLDSADAEARRRAMARFVRHVNNDLGLRVHTSGDPLQKPALVVANHISWHDVFAIGQSIQPRFVAKAEVASWPLLGYYARKAGTLFIKRGSQPAAQHVAHDMYDSLASESVLVFPEGTTSDGHSLLPFKKRLFVPAMERGCPVQPVALYYPGTDRRGRGVAFLNESFAGHLWRTLAMPRIDVFVHYCSPLAVQEDESARELARRVEQVIAEARRQLVERAGG